MNQQAEILKLFDDRILKLNEAKNKSSGHSEVTLCWIIEELEVMKEKVKAKL